MSMLFVNGAIIRRLWWRQYRGARLSWRSLMKMLNKGPFNRRQNWLSDVAILIVMIYYSRFVGLMHEKREKLLKFLSMGLLMKHCLKTTEIEQAGSRWWVHVNDVVVDEVEPRKSSQQSCTEFVVRSTTNVVLYEVVETHWGMEHCTPLNTNCGIVHCTPLAQVNSGRALNSWHFCSWFRIALHYSSRVEKRQSSRPGWEECFCRSKNEYDADCAYRNYTLHNVSRVFIKSQLALDGNSKYSNSITLNTARRCWQNASFESQRRNIQASWPVAVCLWPVPQLLMVEQQIVIEVPSGDCISTVRLVVDVTVGRQINGCIGLQLCVICILVI